MSTRNGPFHIFQNCYPGLAGTISSSQGDSKVCGWMKASKIKMLVEACKTAVKHPEAGDCDCMYMHQREMAPSDWFFCRDRAVPKMAMGRRWRLACAHPHSCAMCLECHVVPLPSLLNMLLPSWPLFNTAEQGDCGVTCTGKCDRWRFQSWKTTTSGTNWRRHGCRDILVVEKKASIFPQYQAQCHEGPLQT